MVPKADSGTFLLLFLLVLSITEPLRPGRGGGGAGAGDAGLPSSACGRVPGPEPCGRGVHRGSPGAGERAAGPGESSPWEAGRVSLWRAASPGGQRRAGAEGRRCRSPPAGDGAPGGVRLWGRRGPKPVLGVG